LAQSPTQSSNPSIGIVYAVLAFGTWGLLPIFWKTLAAISPFEVLCHRVFWSAILLTGLLGVQQRWPDFQKLFAQPRVAFGLVLSATMLGCIWGTYIYAITADRVIEVSLGFFMTPLVSVLLGIVFLQERLKRAQLVAVSLASIGIGYFIWQLGLIPWVALGIALGAALYSLLRKLNSAEPMLGLAVETLLLVPIALGFMMHWSLQGTGSWGHTWQLNGLFVACGATCLPLLWLNHAIQRLPMTTLGFLQYIEPKLVLILGVFVFQETFTPKHWVMFSFIWVALAVYTLDACLRFSQFRSLRAKQSSMASFSKVDQSN
jgi:chloramphenicol-sensitive protein RarD